MVRPAPWISRGMARPPASRAGRTRLRRTKRGDSAVVASVAVPGVARMGRGGCRRPRDRAWSRNRWMTFRC